MKFSIRQLRYLKENLWDNKKIIVIFYKGTKYNEEVEAN